MKEHVDLVIGQDGSIEAIYEDGLADILDANTTEVKRASSVEWETTKDGSGWTVRSAADPETAIRIIYDRPHAQYRKVVGREGDLAVYPKREDALADEVEFFWDIVKEK